MSLVNDSDLGDAREVLEGLADTIEQESSAKAFIIMRDRQRLFYGVREEAIELILRGIRATPGHPVVSIVRRRVERFAPSLLTSEDAPAIRSWVKSEAFLQDAAWWAELALLDPEYAGELLA